MQDDSDTPASQQWDLPSQDFEGYWERCVGGKMRVVSGEMRGVWWGNERYVGGGNMVWR
jgi:hypothetical protein